MSRQTHKSLTRRRPERHREEREVDAPDFVGGGIDEHDRWLFGQAEAVLRELVQTRDAEQREQLLRRVRRIKKKFGPGGLSAFARLFRAETGQHL